jgi:adenylate cyclase
VIGFAGDSMLCWFDASVDEDQGLGIRALSAAFGMQRAIEVFPRLALKVVVASGNARRFVIGDEKIQRLDMLAGATVARTSIGEHLTNRGEVLIDEVTANALGEKIKILEWREDDESKEKFAVIEDQELGVGEQSKAVTEAQSVVPVIQALRPYLLKEVYDRETSGQGAFLTEFRPCVALFIRFTGIDYESDSAESELDAFIRSIQETASRYKGTLLDLIIGDKGSYAYVNFGALSAHEDDSRRAVKTALELKNKTELQLQMGITQGLMRVGAYGGVTRNDFSALGDDVNLAARLMTTASVGEILLSGQAYKEVRNDFTFEPRPPMPMKGKAEPLPVFAVSGKRHQRAIRLQEPNYALPMVGREEELHIIEEELELAANSKGQVIGIVAEAGMGKSRLVAEVIRSAHKKGFVGYGGACQSDGIHTPYLAWKSIWQAFFDVDPEMPVRKLIRWLEGEIEDLALSRVEALPLLSTLLDLNIPDNDFTKSLEPEIRQSALHALLEDCLKTAAQEEPILIVIEDLHWIDALSYDLLEGLAKALASQAVCFVLAYRPPELERLKVSRLESLPQFTLIELHELRTDEAGQAIRAKLAQLYPARGGAVPAKLVDILMARAQGNPFYLEELLNYLRDRGLDPRDPSDLEKIELPNSLHSLILSRIDQLSEQEKTTLRVASIIGRLFRARWLTGYYPKLGPPPRVKAALDALDKLDITPLDSPEPELAYLFKHIVTHEVTYESLPYTTRAKLHEQLARYLEAAYSNALPLETLAFHYGRTDNAEKQREYLRKAGEAAQKNFANQAALDYYGKLLPLLKDENERIEILMQRGIVEELMGYYEEAETDYHTVLEIARADTEILADVQLALGKLNRLRNDYEPALEWLAQAKEGYTVLSNQVGLARALIETGRVLNRKGMYVQAHEPLTEGLKLARSMMSKPEIALAVNNLGALAWFQSDYPTARKLYEEGLTLSRELGDKPGIAASLFSLAIMATGDGNIALAQSLYEESLKLRREIGDKRGIAASITNLGALAILQDNYTKARALSEESLALRREMDDKKGIAGSLHSLGVIAARQGDYATGHSLLEEGLVLERELDDRRGTAYLLNSMGSMLLAQNDYNTARLLLEEGLALLRKMGDKFGVAVSLYFLGNLARIQDDYTAARSLFNESLALCTEMDDKWITGKAQLGLGLLELVEGTSEARRQILQNHRLYQDLGEKIYRIPFLIGVAGLFLQEGDPQRAAQLLGAVESEIETLNIVVDFEFQSFHAQTLAKAREALGKSTFQSAWDEGAKWTLEEALEKALENSTE